MPLTSALAAAAVVLCRFCAKGSLYGLLHSPGCYLSWVQVVAMLLDAARGMEHLHANSVLHRWGDSVEWELHTYVMAGNTGTLQRQHARHAPCAACHARVRLAVGLPVAPHPWTCGCVWSVILQGPTGWHTAFRPVQLLVVDTLLGHMCHCLVTCCCGAPTRVWSSMRCPAGT